MREREQMARNYEEITKRLFNELTLGEIQPKEFVFIRDFAIRKLHPEIFDKFPQTLICTECGKAERATDALARYELCDLPSSQIVTWYWHTWFSITKEGGDGLAACSNECGDALKIRIESKDVVNDDYLGYPESIRYKLIQDFANKAIAYLDKNKDKFKKEKVALCK